jgi:hypothetical protein
LGKKREEGIVKSRKTAEEKMGKERKRKRTKKKREYDKI